MKKQNYSKREVKQALNELVESGELKTVIKDGEIAYVEPEKESKPMTNERKFREALDQIIGCGEGAGKIKSLILQAVNEFYCLLPKLELIGSDIKSDLADAVISKHPTLALQEQNTILNLIDLVAQEQLAADQKAQGVK